MDDIRSLKALQLDALREVANIGAGHAATALSQMIGGTIMISVPTINVSRLEEVPPQISAPEEPVAAVLMHMLGDLTGRTLLVFPKPTAIRLAELMLRRPLDCSLPSVDRDHRSADADARGKPLLDQYPRHCLAAFQVGHRGEHENCRYCMLHRTVAAFLTSS